MSVAMASAHVRNAVIGFGIFAGLVAVLKLGQSAFTSSSFDETTFLADEYIERAKASAFLMAGR